MIQTLAKPTVRHRRGRSSVLRTAEQTVSYRDLRGLSVMDAERRIEPFIDWLRGLSPPRRRALAATEFSRCELWIWARHFPAEVPLINGEYPWIALNSP